MCSATGGVKRVKSGGCDNSVLCSRILDDYLACPISLFPMPNNTR